ncbi:MAG: hypothetical protein Q8R02_10855, partial [Hyphomonadaceae bacterium]|nr:hypothetical protein [Hyphomonadaceae bacterium]
MTPGALPNRRVEGWRWSDLSAALAGREPPLASGDRHVIARLAEGAGQFKQFSVAAGESHIEIEAIGGPQLDVRALEIDVQVGGSLTLVTS